MQIEDENKQGSMVIFTDGSYSHEKGGGAAIALTTETKQQSFGPPNGISNYKMKAMALSIALNHFIDTLSTDMTPVNNTLAIFSDSQAALSLLNNPLSMRTTQYLGIHL